MIFVKFDQNLARNYLVIFSCKILAKFFTSCKKSFIFSARLAKYVQDIMQDIASLARKILVRLVFSCKMVFTGNFLLRALMHAVIIKTSTVGPQLSKSPLSEPSVIRTLFQILKSQKTV